MCLAARLRIYIYMYMFMYIYSKEETFALHALHIGGDICATCPAPCATCPAWLSCPRQSASRYSDSISKETRDKVNPPLPPSWPPSHNHSGCSPSSSSSSSVCPCVCLSRVVP